MCHISIKEALQEAASFLRRQGIAAPRQEAELMLAFLLAKGRAFLYAHGAEELSLELRAKYEEMLRRRGDNVPLAYLTGEKEFMGLPFRVKEGVLIPRPETEHLVETVLQWSRNISPGGADGWPLQILDLGTGCGNIAVALAFYLPEALVLGVDSSRVALDLARPNAQKNGVDARVKFFRGDFRDFFAQNRQRFHVIVSNPPYIPGPQIPFLPPAVQKEPWQALHGGADGLAAYRQIFPLVREALSSSGLLALEVGENQARDVLALGCQAGFTKVRTVADLAGRARVAVFND